jgi:transcriptional regulator with XRE-family HTH domain
MRKMKKQKFGGLLREVREAAGVSLGALARHLLVSVPYLSDVERGHRPPLVHGKIIVAAAFLKADITALLVSAASTRGSFQLDAANLSGHAREVGAMLARQWSEMSDKKLQKMKQLLLEEE